MKYEEFVQSKRRAESMQKGCRKVAESMQKEITEDKANDS